MVHRTSPSPLPPMQGVLWDTGPQVSVRLLVDSEQNLKQQQQERQMEGGQERPREGSLSGAAHSKSTGQHGHRL